MFPAEPDNKTLETMRKFSEQYARRCVRCIFSFLLAQCAVYATCNFMVGSITHKSAINELAKPLNLAGSQTESSDPQHPH